MNEPITQGSTWSRQLESGAVVRPLTLDDAGAVHVLITENRQHLDRWLRWSSGLQRVAGYGVGPKKMSEHFCYLGAQRTYVNLGFNYGASLTDPEGLLGGPGKALRHVKVATASEAARFALRRLLEAALAERREP